MSSTEAPLSKASASVASVEAQKRTVSFPLHLKMMLPSAVILIFFISVVFVVLGSITKIQSRFEAVVAQDVKSLQDVRHLSLLIFSMEAAQKNYIVTGNEEFLATYKGSKDEFIDILQELKIFASNNPEQLQLQLQRLENAESLINLWERRVATPEIELGKKVHQAKVGADYLQQVLRQGAGKKISEELQIKFNELRQQFGDIGDTDGELKVLEVARGMASMEASQRGFIITGHEDFLKPFNLGVKRINTHIDQLRNRVIEDSDQHLLVEAIDSLVRQWFDKSGLPEIEARYEMNEHPESFHDLSILLQNQIGQNILGDLKYNFDLLITGYEERMSESFAAATAAAKNAQFWSVILAGLAVVISILVGLFIIRSITHPISNLVLNAYKMRDGVLDESISIQTNDEIGVLSNAFDEMRIGLEKSYRGLEEKTQELEEFAYRTSHDLRSPLVSSIALIDVVQNAITANKPEMAVKALGIIQSSLIKLETLVKDILALTKTNNFEEQEEEVDIAHHVDETLNKLSNMENFERLDIQMDFQLKGPINAKKSRMVLIIENLISNAIKYQDTQEEFSYIKISTYTEEQNFIFEVKDNGLGIPKEQQGKLFTMFNRFHNKVSFGSGLGLYMIEKSANALGGQVSFEDPGKGSIFKLIVPVSLET